MKMKGMSGTRANCSGKPGAEDTRAATAAGPRLDGPVAGQTVTVLRRRGEGDAIAFPSPHLTAAPTLRNILRRFILHVHKALRPYKRRRIFLTRAC